MAGGTVVSGGGDAMIYRREKWSQLEEDEC